MIILVMVAVAAGAVVVLLRADEDDDAGARTGAGQGGAAAVTTTTVPPTTTIPRITQMSLLDAYCTAPGAKWPEVPAHVPGEPDRTYVHVSSAGVDTARDSESTDYPGQMAPEQMGGSTVISPQTDGAFTRNETVLPRTRTVACVSLLGTDGVGTSCPYNGILGDLRPVTLQSAVNKFDVTVYELHSGGILHKGEIHTRTNGCPPWAITNDPSGMVAYGLTNQDLLTWFNSHFVGGKPA